MAAESEEADLRDSLSRLKDISNQILGREIQALGVFNSLDSEREIILTDPDFAWSKFPVIELID